MVTYYLNDQDNNGGSNIAFRLSTLTALRAKPGGKAARSDEVTVEIMLDCFG